MDTSTLQRLQYRMTLVRALEVALGDAHAKGLFRGPLHRCDGQEAVGIGVTSILEQIDFITTTHRGHAHIIGKGVKLGPMVAEIMGKATGVCQGRAGHQLIADVGKGVIGGNGIVGSSIPIATGMALALKRRASGGVVVCFFGDGNVNAGAFNEGLNMAALWRLPVVFVCENNQFGLTVALNRHMANPEIVDRAAGYGMPGENVFGNDVEVVAERAAAAVARARSGEGPTLLVAQTYRRLGFSTTDLGGYMSPEDLERWPDPLDVTAERLRTSGVEQRELDSQADTAQAEVAAAVAAAVDAPYPDVADYLSRARR